MLLQMDSFQLSMSHPVGKHPHFSQYTQFFKKNNYLKISNFLDSELALRVKTELKKSNFIETAYKVGKDETFYDGPLPVLSFLTRTPLMYQYIETLTERKAVDFIARGFRMTSKSKGYEWHTDQTHSQSVGITVCLSKKKYQGGTFLMRHISNPQTIIEIENTIFGDAILFGVGEGWEHKVTPVTGIQPKMSFVGWFFSEKITPDIFTNLYE